MNFDDLCEAITFLHSQMQSNAIENIQNNALDEIDEQMMSETIIF